MIAIRRELDHNLPLFSSLLDILPLPVYTRMEVMGALQIFNKNLAIFSETRKEIFASDVL
jgi:hypothetical protein